MPSAAEQYQIERINAARLDPMPGPEALNTRWGPFGFDPQTGFWRFDLDPAAAAVRALDAGVFAIATLALDYIAADFNGDSRVTTTDALDILRVAVGLQANHSPRWLFIGEASLPDVFGPAEVPPSQALTLAAYEGGGEVEPTVLLTGDLRASG